MNTPILSIKNLSQSIGTRKILTDISLEAHTKNVTVFLGPNGAGKTTLLKTVVGLLDAPKSTDEQNKILFDGNEINQWPVHQRVTHGLVYLPQHTALFSQMSVWDNLKLVYENHALGHFESRQARF